MINSIESKIPSPDRSNILFLLSLSKKRYSEEQENAPNKIRTIFNWIPYFCAL
ncbi:hypothetical protein RCH33_2759 [Flavobacterium daejeonense]|nr:hypothetical protein RCH33_2759 [Flavobacterium daejeonense]